MRHAGISVTVTSITDVMAFGLGAFTIMPGLQVCVIIIRIVLKDMIKIKIYTYYKTAFAIMPGLQVYVIIIIIVIKDIIKIKIFTYICIIKPPSRS